MSPPARAVPATTNIDRFTTSGHIAEYAYFATQLDGTHPYVRVVFVDVPSAPFELLPAGATIERCVTTDVGVTVLAHHDDATIHIEALPRATTIQVATTTHAGADELAEQIRRRLPDPPGDTASVRIWHHNDGRPPTATDRSIEAPCWADIAPNYPPAARASVAALVRLRAPVANGKLVLWHGPPGTGKTTALRALMREWGDWCEPQYIADPERFFGEPAYMAHVLTTAAAPHANPTLTRAGRPEAVWRLLIAEDCDEYLRASARRDAGAALGRLLNLADGILGQGMNVLVLLTTNEEISELHPALVRPGRCLATVHFSPFDVREAAEWLGENVGQSMTLAELLEHRGDLARITAAPPALDGIGQYL